MAIDRINLFLEAGYVWVVDAEEINYIKKGKYILTIFSSKERLKLNEQIIGQLKRIYELEKFQINYYISQLSSTQNSILDKALSKIIETDKIHTDYFEHIFTEVNIEIPRIASTIANIAGSIVGESIELTGQANTCKIGVALEDKVLSAYYELIRENDLESKLDDKLIDFKLDKEFHMLWLQHFAQYLKHRSSEKNYLLTEGIEEHPTVNFNMRWI